MNRGMFLLNRFLLFLPHESSIGRLNIISISRCLNLLLQVPWAPEP